jgi:hypothetical protein
MKMRAIIDAGFQIREDKAKMLNATLIIQVMRLGMAEAMSLRICEGRVAGSVSALGMRSFCMKCVSFSWVLHRCMGA